MHENKTLERLYVASPCAADWDAMPGTEQVRFCNQCALHVYNISAMTKSQAEELIANTEGRLCTKFYRRADGTIITRDCPVGLRAVRQRVSRAASAALSAVLSLFAHQTIGWADEAHKNCQHYKAKITRLSSATNLALIEGRVSDALGVVIVKAKVTVTDEQTKHIYTAQTDNEGKYRFSSLPAGAYSIVIFSRGFASFRKKQLKISHGEALQLDVELQVGTVGGAAFLPEKETDGTPHYVQRA